MRKLRVRQIRQRELASPEGMSRATFKAAKRKHSNGLLRVPQPKLLSRASNGFPAQSKQLIVTWTERGPRREMDKVKELQRSKTGNVLKVIKRLIPTGLRRAKRVTRIITQFAKK